MRLRKMKNGQLQLQGAPAEGSNRGETSEGEAMAMRWMVGELERRKENKGGGVGC